MSGVVKALVFAVVVVGLGSISAKAADAASPWAVQVAARSWQHIEDFSSAPGETKEAFLTRIAPALRAYSDKTGFEACGAIGTDGKGAFAVVLGSSRSHIACVSYHNRVAAGMVSTGETIHSHGTTGSFNFNRVDKALYGDGEKVGIILMPAHSQVLDRFSPTDLAGGPGYLATPTGLIYQAGGKVAQPQ